jgi:uncharacterized protein (DUF952 family)
MLFTLAFIFVFISNDVERQRSEALKLVKEQKWDEAKLLVALLGKVVDHKDHYLHAYALYRKDKQLVQLCSYLYLLHQFLIQLEFLQDTGSIPQEIYETTVYIVHKHSNARLMFDKVQKLLKNGNPEKAVRIAGHLARTKEIDILHDLVRFLRTFLSVHEEENKISTLPTPDVLIEELKTNQFIDEV